MIRLVLATLAVAVLVALLGPLQLAAALAWLAVIGAAVELVRTLDPPP